MDLRQYIQFFKKLDLRILFIGTLLVLFGLATIYSIGIHSTEPDLSKFYKQLIFSGIGFAVMISMIFVDYRILRNFAWVIYIFGALLLLSVLLFGVTIRGTTGWLNFGIFFFQPVEIAKITLAIMLASWYDHHVDRLEQARYLLASAAMTGVYVGLVLAQPDLGSALVFIGMWFIMLFVIKTKWLYRIIIIVSFILVIIASWFFLADYQKDRINTFLNPASKPLKEGYNVTQSIIAVGSGQFYGRGLGLGPQSQLNFLPEQETDFIFAVIAEELGLLGAGIVIASFGILFHTTWQRAKSSVDNFSMFFMIFAIIQLFIQTFINVGMNIGIMPVTGIPLPFISAGGSSLLASFLLLGIFESIIVRQAQKN